jgi:GT2 family glycosyltransferase
MLFAKLYNLTNLNSDFKFISLVKVECQTFVAAVNKIAKAAYEEGMDYFVRINDDTVFITSNWSTLAIDVLRSYDPPDVGVVGPTCNEGNTGIILTHDMVHRTHLDIFPYYYPPVFENWFSNTWITRVYKPDRSTKLTTWTVEHLIQRNRYPYKKTGLWRCV